MTLSQPPVRRARRTNRKNAYRLPIYLGIGAIASALACSFPTARGITHGSRAGRPGFGGAAASAGDAKPFTQKLPGVDVSFDMVPIPGGKFTMGSPETEKKRKADEGPQFEVEVEPF